MTTYARKPLRIDSQKSNFWAIESLSSVGAGPFGVALFDLVNRETHRAHRLALKSVGFSKGLPYSASFTSSGYYENFSVPFDRNFSDFDGIPLSVSDTSVGLYSWTILQFPNVAPIEISSSGISVPTRGVATGITEVLYGDGQPVDTPDLIQEPFRLPKDPEPFQNFTKEEAFVQRLPTDVLFDFDQYLLKRGQRTDDALELLSSISDYKASFRILIIGHTDSTGPKDYNLRLSKKRAETVAKWMIEHAYLRPDEVKTVGMGFAEPVASNATEDGRSENRRVEAVALLKKYWDSY